MKQFKKMIAVMVVLTMVFTLASCGNDKTEENNEVTTSSISNSEGGQEVGSGSVLTGEVTVSGSTSVEKIGNATGEEFSALNPGVTFTYEGIGSSAGVKNANDKVTNIGTASRNLKESEEAYGLTVKVIAYDGIAVILNPDNGVEGLTMLQVQKIYKGEITNWSEVGGADEAIAVVSREDGSGTRGAFEELVEFEEALTADALLKEGNGNVQTTVAENPQAIGYVSFTYLDDSVKGIEIEGTLPTVENVLNGSFPISRPFLMMYHEDNMTDASRAYVEFVMSKEGQDIVEAKGGIRVDAAEAMTEDASNDTSNDIVLTGEVTVSGSTSVEKIGNATGEEFAALNPGVSFTYEGIGSSAGVKNANDKVTNIGTASRNLKESEEAYGMTVEVIAYDGIAVVVHPDNGIEGLTMDQVLKIYKGEITNWSEVGGADEAIAVISREDGSGTRGAFEELVGFEEELTANALLKEGNGNVQTTVAENPQAIGYVSFTYLDDTIKGIEIEGTLPTVENVLNGSFPISRPFLMMYHEDNMTDASRAYVEFVMSKEGQDIVEAKGGIRVD